MLFSVIVPIYNVEKYLEECIQSILSQTFNDFELILVDDGSTDNSAKICDDFASLDKRVKVIHKKNGGVTSARKEAATLSSGNFIVPVDGDDYISKDYLQKAYDVLKKDDIDVFCFNFCIVTKKKLLKNKELFLEGFYDKSKLEKDIYPYLMRGENGKRFNPCIWGKIFKRDLFLKYLQKVDNKIKIGEDECVTFPLVFNSKKIFISQEHNYFYRQNIDSATKSRKKGYPWEDVYLRKIHHETNLPMQCFDFQNQLNRLIVHELFSISVSHLIAEKQYQKVKKEILREFNKPEFQEAIKNCFYKNNIKEKLALYAVKYKKIFLIKIYSKLI